MSCSKLVSTRRSTATNALAYYKNSQIIAAKSLITLGSRIGIVSVSLVMLELWASAND